MRIDRGLFLFGLDLMRGQATFAFFGLILGYFQHHRVRTSSVLSQGFLENKGAAGSMRFLLDSSSVAMGLVHFTVKNEQNVTPRKYEPGDI